MHALLPTAANLYRNVHHKHQGSTLGHRVCCISTLCDWTKVRATTLYCYGIWLQPPTTQGSAIATRCGQKYWDSKPYCCVADAIHWSTRQCDIADVLSNQADWMDRHSGWGHLCVLLYQM